MSELTEIQSFYKDKTIFITGGSGLMGKVLIEKLLYSCSDIRKIYVLMRPKRGRTPELRIDEMFKLPVIVGEFDTIRYIKIITNFFLFRCLVEFVKKNLIP